jgi:hypothetical protein
MAEDMLRRLHMILSSRAIFAEKRKYLHSLLFHLHHNCWNLHRRSIQHPSANTNMSSTNESFRVLAEIKSQLAQIDKTAYEQELKTKHLLQLAQNFVAARRIKNFRACINVAQDLQTEKIKLLKTILKLEKRLLNIGRNLTLEEHRLKNNL